MSEAEWGPIVSGKLGHIVPGKFRTGANKPVVALDIDGTLGDYHSHFLWFAEKWLGISMPSPEDNNPGMRLSEFMRIPHHQYQECKLAYRQGGLKRFMPAYDYAWELTHSIRMAGAELWICTTRPYLRLDNIDPDTREWLSRNHIEYDAVIFEGLNSQGKYSEMVEQTGLDRIVAAVDDLPEQVLAARNAGISRIYLRDQPYNRGVDLPAVRVHSLIGLWQHISRDISEWKARHDE